MTFKAARLKRNQRLFTNKGCASMGYDLPAIIGAYFADNKKDLICITGDGSLMMNLQELATIEYYKIPAKIFVINNKAYAVIRKRMVELFRRTIGTDEDNGVGTPEFKKVAKAFNFGYVKIESSNNLEGNLKSVMDMDGPILCEIMGLENQKYISSGHARNLKGAIVSRPLEDQTPYMDRNLFLSEMIVEPIDQ